MAEPSPYAVAWRLHAQHIDAGTIGMTLGIHRATVFRWLAGIRLRGLRGFERRMRSCHTHSRSKRVHRLVPALVVECRNRYGFCGAKIVWWLRTEHGLTVSEATVYRILRSAIRRSLVVGDRLLTVSARGVMAHDLTTLESRGWAEFVR